MADPATFEARLADAFEQYAIGAPVGVDSRGLAAELAHRPRTRFGRGVRFPVLASRTARIALVAALLGLLAFAGALVAGGWRARPLVPPPLGDSRLFVWQPTATNHGIATLVGADGMVLASREMDARGCPQLIAGTGDIVVPGFEILSIQTVDGRSVDTRVATAGQVDTNHYTLERWSPDRRSIAVTNAEGGVTTVVHLDPSAASAGATRYGLSGQLGPTLDAAFSTDGTRLALLVAGAPGTTDIHLLGDGDDRAVATLAHADADLMSLAMSPDGTRLAVVQDSGGAQRRVDLVSLDHGTVTPTSEVPASGSPLSAISWSPDGRWLAVAGGDSSVDFLDVGAGSWTASPRSLHGPVAANRWSPDLVHPGVAMLDGGGHLSLAMVLGTRDRRILSSGSSAFSPDGSSVASVSGDEQPYQAGIQASVWAVDVWGDAAPRTIAKLPAVSAALSDSSLTPCVDWLPGGRS